MPRLGEGLSLTRMPAHWMLGRLGERVMRPGGFGPSRRMVEALAPSPAGSGGEMWPGLGRKAELTLAAGPRSYVGIEPRHRNEKPPGGEEGRYAWGAGA